MAGVVFSAGRASVASLANRFLSLFLFLCVCACVRACVCVCGFSYASKGLAVSGFDRSRGHLFTQKLIIPHKFSILNYSVTRDKL